MFETNTVATKRPNPMEVDNTECYSDVQEDASGDSSKCLDNLFNISTEEVSAAAELNSLVTKLTRLANINVDTITMLANNIEK